MKNSHPNQARFPYTAEELAIYMQYVINKTCPVEDEVYKSETSEEYVD
jgi:hypothetical protein